MPVAELLQGLREIYAASRLFTEPARVAPYESDALTSFRCRPEAVVLPETREEVIATARACHGQEVPFVARGSGTSLSGGSLPVEDGIVIGLNRLKPRPGPRPAGADRRRRARRHQCPRLPRRGPRAVLRARSVEPVDMHDRRQQRLQLRRRPLPQHGMTGHNAHSG